MAAEGREAAPGLAPLFIYWERVAGELFERTARFPKACRFTFSQRVENLTLDILELLAAAQWTAGRSKREKLSAADERLLRLRVILRLAHTRQVLDHKGYEHLARTLDEAGRMLGGWLRHGEQEGR